MSYDERRITLQRQHQRLRSLIAQVRGAAMGVLEGGTVSAQELRDQVGVLRTELLEHLLAEEALLGPVLERIDAWGPVRLELMQAEHAHQRAVIAVLWSDRAVSLSPELLARRTLGLLDDIVTDMDAEDRDLLDAKVLCDDVIQLDASDC